MISWANQPRLTGYLILTWLIWPGLNHLSTPLTPCWLLPCPRNWWSQPVAAWPSPCPFPASETEDSNHAGERKMLIPVLEYHLGTECVLEKHMATVQVVERFKLSELELLSTQNFSIKFRLKSDDLWDRVRHPALIHVSEAQRKVTLTNTPHGTVGKCLVLPSLIQSVHNKKVSFVSQVASWQSRCRTVEWMSKQTHIRWNRAARVVLYLPLMRV